MQDHVKSNSTIRLKTSKFTQRSRWKKNKYLLHWEFFFNANLIVLSQLILDMISLSLPSAETLHVSTILRLIR